MSSRRDSTRPSSSFNEAGAKRPRNSPISSMARPWVSCFNEAGAKRPRNCPSALSCATRQFARFNEAGAKRPRNFREAGRATRELARASMRPGRRGPGIACQRVLAVAADHASMRPGRRGPGIRETARRHTRPKAGFNEAGAKRPRNSLQRRQALDLRLLASMRPGRRGPGILTRRLISPTQDSLQ